MSDQEDNTKSNQEEAKGEKSDHSSEVQESRNRNRRKRTK